jgi:hypothetical protein
MVIRVRLPATALRHYLQPSGGQQVSGRVLSASVRHETLVPAGAVLASSQDAGLVELPIQVDPGDMAQGLRPGDSVQVLAALPRAPAGPGGRPAAIRRGRPGPARSRRARRHGSGTGRPAAHARRPRADRGRRPRHRPDLRGEDPRPGHRASGHGPLQRSTPAGAGYSRVGTGSTWAGIGTTRRVGTASTRVRIRSTRVGAGSTCARTGSTHVGTGTYVPVTSGGGGHVKVRLVTAGVGRRGRRRWSRLPCI